MLGSRAKHVSFDPSQMTSFSALRKGWIQSKFIWARNKLISKEPKHKPNTTNMNPIMNMWVSKLRELKPKPKPDLSWA